MTEKEIYELIKQKIEEIQKYRRRLNYNKIYELEEEINRLEEELLKVQMKNWKLVGNDGIIDLFKPTPTVDGPYFIFFHDLSIEIGEITYRPEYSNTLYGDISYEIDEKYRGKSFALNGLLLLVPYLKENGVDKIRISSFESNVASIKTLENLNRNLGNGHVTRNATDRALIYNFDLTKNKHL